MASPSKHLVHARDVTALLCRLDGAGREASYQGPHRAKPADLDKPLRGVVATFAGAHERAEPKFVNIAVMRLSVIADCRRLDNAALKVNTHSGCSRSWCFLIRAQRGFEYHASPLGWSATNAHSLELVISPANYYRSPRLARMRKEKTTTMMTAIAYISLIIL